jgi:hypothetical protein
MEKDAEGKGEQRGERAVFVDVGESSGVAPCSALPDQTTAKPGGADTTTEITSCFYIC